MSIQAPAHETVRAPEDVVASSAVEESTMQSSTSKKPSLTYDGYPSRTCAVGSTPAPRPWRWPRASC